MKILSFLLLLFISILKIESASYIPLYFHQHSVKNNIECNPAQNDIKSLQSFIKIPSQKFHQNSDDEDPLRLS